MKINFIWMILCVMLFAAFAYSDQVITGDGGIQMIADKPECAEALETETSAYSHPEDMNILIRLNPIAPEGRFLLKSPDTYLYSVNFENPPVVQYGFSRPNSEKNRFI